MARVCIQNVSRIFCSALIAALLMMAMLWVTMHSSPAQGEKKRLLSSSVAATLQHKRMPRTMTEGAVCVNTATLQELCNLSGVGPVLAEAILWERKQGGPFSFPEDLLSVKGIGEKKWATLVEQISLQ